MRTKAQLIADRLRDFADDNRKGEWINDEDYELMFEAAELIDRLEANAKNA
jgi:hypothetical protein